MAGLLVLMTILIVIVASVTVATTVILNAINKNNQRRQLPPQQPWPGPAGPGALGPTPQPSARAPYRLSAADQERILVLLRGGQKIHAIKLYREITGSGLKEAKDAVEHLERYQ